MQDSGTWLPNREGLGLHFLMFLTFSWNVQAWRLFFMGWKARDNHSAMWYICDIIIVEFAPVEDSRSYGREKDVALKCPLKGGCRYKILDIEFQMPKLKCQMNVKDQSREARDQNGDRFDLKVKHLIILALLDFGRFTIGSSFEDISYYDRL